LAALTLSTEVGVAAIVVADAARKSRNNETWRTVVIKLPDPRSNGDQWLVAMAAFVNGDKPAPKIAPAIREFYAAVGSLIELITQARHRRSPQRSLLPDEESSGELQVVPSARARTPRAARERREDSDERGRSSRHARAVGVVVAVAAGTFKRQFRSLRTDSAEHLPARSAPFGRKFVVTSVIL
jgi:hypothetical protein